MSEDTQAAMTPLDDTVLIPFRDGREFRISMLIDTIMKVESALKVKIGDIDSKGIQGVVTLLRIAINNECGPHGEARPESDEIAQSDLARNLSVLALNRIGREIGVLLGATPPLPGGDGSGPSPE